MSRTGRASSSLLISILMTVALAGCGSSSGSRATPATTATTTASPSASPTSATYNVVPKTRARAQRLLDRAAVAPGSASMGSFKMSLVLAGTPATVSGRYVYTPESSRIEYQHQIAKATIRVRLIGNDGWFTGQTPGQALHCWVHLRRHVGEQAQRVGGVASAMVFLALPRARGLLAGGRPNQVVMDLDTAQALVAMVPKLGNLVGTAPGSTVPAIATVAHGRFSSLVFPASAVVAAADRDRLFSLMIKEGMSTATTPEDFVSGDATVIYDVGARAAPIEPPPASQVADAVDIGRGKRGACS